MFTIPESVIFYINPLLLLFFLFVLYRGYKKGFILQVLDLISLGVAAIIAWLFAPVFARVFAFVSVQPTTVPLVDNVINESLNQLVWFGVLLLVIRLALLVITPLASMISKMPLIKQVNSLVGGIFSIVVYLVYVLLIMVFFTLPIVTNGQTVIDNTALSMINDVTKPVLSSLNETLEKNIALQSILSQRSLTRNQEDWIVAWLQEQGFTQDIIREFLARYE